MSLPKTYKAAQITKAGAPFDFVDRELKKPERGQILVKVLACGVCHSEVVSVHKVFPFIQLPLVPGHEIVGTVVAVPDSEKKWKVDDVVGGPWHGGHDGTCSQCQQGHFVNCKSAAVNGVSKDGGYAEYCLLNTEAVVRIPKGADPVEVAPLLCAGVTVFNGIRNVEHLEAGDLVAVQGLGGLGHLGVQFADKMGYDVVALSSSDNKRDLAKQLGAQHYVYGSAEEQAKKLQELGGAKLIVITAPNAKAVSPLIDGLAPYGTLLILGLQEEPIPFNTATMLSNSLKVKGHPSGGPIDSEDTIRFALSKGVKSWNKIYDFKDAQQAYDDMMAGKPRFRNVLKF